MPGYAARVAGKRDWEPPSERAAELIRTVAMAVRENPIAIFALVDDATAEAAPERMQSDPGLSEALFAANHANMMHWVEATIRDPGMEVPPNTEPAVIDLGRDIVRRGFDGAAMESYRVGQNAALRFLTSAIFEMTDDPVLIRELLEVTTRTIYAFVDDTIAATQAHIERERDQLTRGTHAERLEVTNLILEGAPITEARASSRLGYELAGRHLAAVIWSAEAPGHGELEGAAQALARAVGAERPFNVVAGERALWAWIQLPSAEAPDLGPARKELGGGEGPRVAVGSTAPGIEGFRRSHLDALATQRLMQRATGLRLAAYRDVELVVLATQNEGLASEFVGRVLGELAAADPILRETIRVYIREQFNTSAAARSLYAHRNTVINRLERARDLLPRPLEQHGLEIGLALEIDHWLGSDAGSR